MQREDAWALVNEYTTQPHLIRHMLAVEAAMRAYAERFGENVELWGLAGLLHDFDYEQNPDVSIEGHPIVGSRILKELGYQDEVVSAMLSHAAEITGVEPELSTRKNTGRRRRDDRLPGRGRLIPPEQEHPRCRAQERAQEVEDERVRRACASRRSRARRQRDWLSLDDHILVVLDAMKGCAAKLGLERQEAA